MFARLVFVNTFAAALVAVVPALSHAEAQTEWLQRQLQVTDGYIPPPATPMHGKEKDNKEGPFEGTALKGKQEKPATTPSKGSGFRSSSDGRIFTQDGIEVSA
jgi:hypothetical protein